MISIIIPTYNERDVILHTIEGIHKALGDAHDYEIIVCDDDSPDLTWKLIQDRTKDDHRLRILRRRSDKGLSTAVVDGFDHAKGDLLAVMDADGQHDERILPTMLRKAEHADLVLPSRFIKGGGVSGWSKSRLLISRSFALLSRPLLRSKVSDPMSGYFLIRREVYERVKHDLDTRGYKILLSILFASQHLKGLRIKEVPYVFRPRELGESKAGVKVAFQYIGMLISQLVRSNRRFLKFSAVGLSGVVVNFAILIFFTEIIGLYYVYSSLIAIETSVITNFLLNNAWTWNNQSYSYGFLSRFLRFNLVSIIALFLNVIVLYSLTEYLGLWYIISNACGILAATLVNFSVNNLWTFKK